jgi:hypothetical protein
MAITDPPDIEISGFYYPEIIADLLGWKRRTPGIREIDEDEAEPWIQAMRGFAWTEHVSNTLMDAIGQECLYETLNLRPSLRSHYAQIGEHLEQASPSSVDELARIVSRFSADNTRIFRAYDQFSTSAETADEEVVNFETLEDVVVEQRNDRVGHVFAFNGTSYQDHTAEAQSESGSFTPGWGAAPSAGDMLFIGHESVMWDQIDVSIATPAAQIIHGVLEYFEDDYNDGSPDSVTQAGGTLVFVLTGLLGSENRAGTVVRVQYPGTGGYQDLVSTFLAGLPSSVADTGTAIRFNLNGLLGSSDVHGTIVTVRHVANKTSQELTSLWDGVNNYVVTSGSDPYLGQTPPPSTTVSDYWVDVGPNKITTVDPEAYLGQTEPSLDANDYVVGSNWRELPDLVDGTDKFQAAAGDHTIEFTLPQNETRNCAKTTVNAVEAYWQRFRVIAVGSAPTAPAINQMRIDEGDQWILFGLVQGATKVDDPLWSSTGLPDQEAPLSYYPVLDTTARVLVNESGTDREYTRVDDFYNSGPDDRHFVPEVDDYGRGKVKWGNGVNGKIPPPGVDNVLATYRIVEDVDGDVPAGAITVSGGGAYVDAVTNPRKASGWAMREGITEEDLARAKLAGPARMRTNGRGVGTRDIVTLALAWQNSAGERPIRRAVAIEAGGKTTEVVVVGGGGGLVSSDNLTALEEYFNDETDGVVVMNQEVLPTNFAATPINVTATLHPLTKNPSEEVKAAMQESAEAALTGILTPVAQERDGTWMWDFGEEVPESKIKGELQKTTSPAPRKVVLGGTGTGTISSGGGGGVLVTGIGTGFTTQLNRGDKITVGSQTCKVNNILSDLQLITETAFNPALSGEAFAFEKGDVPMGASSLPTKGTVSIQIASE